MLLIKYSSRPVLLVLSVTELTLASLSSIFARVLGTFIGLVMGLLAWYIGEFARVYPSDTSRG